MISFLFSLLPFIFITYYMTMLRKTKYITMDLRNGEICYCCKDKIEMDKNDVLYNILNNKANYQICKSCQRDEKLDEIVTEKTSHMSTQVGIQLPKLKKATDEATV